MRATTLSLCWLLLAQVSLAGDTTPAASQFRSLLEQYEQQGDAPSFAPRFIEFAERNSQDPAAVDALLWIVENVRGKSDTTRALERLATGHFASKKLGPASKLIANSRSVAGERLLRVILEKNPDRQVCAQACYYLALLLDLETSLVEQLAAEPDLAPRVLQYYGKEYGQHLTTLERESLTRQREQVYERLLKSFADVEINDTTMGAVAEKALFAIRHLSVGSLAPEIKGEDIHGEQFKLSDYRGKVVMLSFWGHW